MPAGSYHIHEPHPVYGWRPKPGVVVRRQTQDFDVTVRINSRGLRDVEHKFEPAPGVHRIVILGDSFMEAEQVELEETTARLLEANLADLHVETVNLGVTAFGTAQEYLRLREEGLKYRPDLVVLAVFLQNDIQNNSLVLETRLRPGGYRVFSQPYLLPGAPGDPLEFGVKGEDRYERYYASNMAVVPLPVRLKTWVRGLATGRVLIRNLDNTRWGDSAQRDPNMWLGTFLREFNPEWHEESWSAEEWRAAFDEAWISTERLILAARDLTEANGAQFILMTVPSLIEVDERYREALKSRFPGLEFDIETPLRRLETLCADNDVLLLNLHPAFQEEALRGSLHHRIEDRHWNPRGHRLAAERLAAFIREHIAFAPGS